MPTQEEKKNIQDKLKLLENTIRTEEVGSVRHGILMSLKKDLLEQLEEDTKV